MYICVYACAKWFRNLAAELSQPDFTRTFLVPLLAVSHTCTAPCEPEHCHPWITGRC